MNIRDILDVKAICDAGSLRKAADRLGITQSTLSTRLRHLEDRLGIELFDRTQGVSRPTELARFIASRADRIAADASALARDAERLAAGETGLVRVGLGPFAARVLLPDFVGTISDRHPSIRLEILTHTSREGLLELLLRHRIDIAVCQPFGADPPSIQGEVLMQSDIVLVAAPGHPLFERSAPASVPEVLEYPLATSILDPGYVNAMKRHSGIDIDELPGRIVCTDMQMLLTGVMKSRRLVLAAPRLGLRREIEAGELRVINVAIPIVHSISVYSNRGAHALPAAATVRAVIREIVG